MKSSVPKPLMRLATAHTSAVVSNKPQGSQARSTLPLVTSRASSSSSSSSSSPEALACVPVSSRINNVPLYHNFSTTARPLAGYKFNGRLGTLALLGGVMLYFGTPTAHSFFPFSKPTPASRMKERLDKHGFVERLVIPDGNCQMRSLADQIHGTENYYVDVRSKIVSWLNTNEKFSVDDEGTATLGDFIDRDQFPKWATYTTYMSRNGTWGDHITLLAAAEVYGVNIGIISNVDDNGTGNYVTSIHPRSKKPTKTINLSHWHEMHYNSLYPINPPKQAS
jgi:hypothetical protein